MKEYLVALSKVASNWVRVEAHSAKEAELVALEKADFLLWNDGDIIVESTKEIKNESKPACEKIKAR